MNKKYKFFKNESKDKNKPVINQKNVIFYVTFLSFCMKDFPH